MTPNHIKTFHDICTTILNRELARTDIALSPKYRAGAARAGLRMTTPWYICGQIVYMEFESPECMNADEHKRMDNLIRELSGTL